MNEFEKELQSLINKHSMENASNTPDFILAEYMRSCLEALNVAVEQRETWYGRPHSASHPTNPTESLPAGALFAPTPPAAGNAPKPPIGLRPREIAESIRSKEIFDACLRYARAKMPIPEAWIAELHELTFHPDK